MQTTSVRWQSMNPKAMSDSLVRHTIQVGPGLVDRHMAHLFILLVSRAPISKEGAPYHGHEHDMDRTAMSYSHAARDPRYASDIEADYHDRARETSRPRADYQRENDAQAVSPSRSMSTSVPYAHYPVHDAYPDRSAELAAGYRPSRFRLQPLSPVHAHYMPSPTHHYHHHHHLGQDMGLLHRPYDPLEETELRLAPRKEKS